MVQNQQNDQNDAAHVANDIHPGNRRIDIFDFGGVNDVDNCVAQCEKGNEDEMVSIKFDVIEEVVCPEEDKPKEVDANVIEEPRSEILIIFMLVVV